jgi:hypothetical protein
MHFICIKKNSLNKYGNNTSCDNKTIINTGWIVRNEELKQNLRNWVSFWRYIKGIINMNIYKSIYKLI